MKYDYETNIQAQGFNLICGIDEAGRGCLAGPLVAGAVILDPEALVEEARDSKLLNAKKRDELIVQILAKAKCWSIGMVTHEEINRHGLAFANKIAMKRAWKHLPIRPDYILSDYMAKVVFETPFELIKGGDRTVLSIASASIIAKVFRDRMMLAFAKKYPGYGFEEHKGYGTKLHLEKLDELGPCPIHRVNFGPVREKFF